MTIHSASDHGYQPVIYLCTCGSGKERYPLEDAAGIFCAYVCEDCEDAKRATYNPQIFAGGSRYAGSGEEEDLFIDEDERLDRGLREAEDRAWRAGNED